MSTFSGKQYKGARRAHKLEKVIAAYERALSIWNDGTGHILVGDEALLNLDLKQVQHPFYKLPKRIRTGNESAKEKGLGLGHWPLVTEIFPKSQHVLECLRTGTNVTGLVLDN